MKVIILAGGFGTRISEYTNSIPKPMVPIGGKPMLWHIMNNFSYFGLSEFCLALGYKSEVIKQYLVNYKNLNSDFHINISTGNISYIKDDEKNWNISAIDTGLNTMTGGRLKRMEPFLKDESFILTYGDALANVDINELMSFHKDHGKMVTVTAVRPTARFGELDIQDDKVNSFKEKPQIGSGWVNGGFFVMEPEFIELIENDETTLEAYPLEKAAEMGELMAYKHEGFWQCMDTKRDKDFFQNLWDTNQKYWLLKK